MTGFGNGGGGEETAEGRPVAPCIILGLTHARSCGPAVHGEGNEVVGADRCLGSLAVDEALKRIGVCTRSLLVGQILHPCLAFFALRGVDHLLG